MSEDKKKKEELEITEEENAEKQFEFGLNEDKRKESEEDGHKLPEEQNEVSSDAKTVDYKDDNNK